MLVEKRPTSTESENSCSVSKLEIYDYGEAKANSSGTSVAASEPSHLFCGETGPRLCAHAADYPPTYLPPRPCEVNVTMQFILTEIFLRYILYVPKMIIVLKVFRTNENLRRGEVW